MAGIRTKSDGTKVSKSTGKVVSSAKSVVSSSSSSSSKLAQPAYGSTVIDAAGRSGIAKFDVNTGKALSAGAGTSADKFSKQTGELNPDYVDPANTAQPSPTTVQAGAGLPGTPQPDLSKIVGAQYYDQKTGALNAAGEKFKQGLATTNASGTPIPATAGEAAGVIASTVPKDQAQQPSPLTGIVETDTTFDDIFAQFDDYYSPVKQKQSLLQEYKSMEKSLGINAMNEELLDSKRIIEGTEDDIRSEVQAVSGFATDSQVIALSNARNKSLVKNYNYLLEARDSAMTQLNTMMNLSIQDRQMAQQEFDTKMNFAFKVAEFKEKAVANAREGYNNTIKLMGADGMYNALLSTGDPQAMSLAERTLGIPQGGLAIAAQQATQTRALEDQKASLQNQVFESNLLTDKAQRENIYSQIDERNNLDTGGVVTLNGKPQNANQLTANSYADRLVEANRTIDILGEDFTGKLSQVPMLNFMKTSDRQLYEQAQRNFINSVLRRESGAAIAESEFDSARQQYFPQAGDGPEVVQQKAQSRNTAINNFYREANVPNPNNSIRLPNGDIVPISN